jgi:DNA replication protein DnaC
VWPFAESSRERYRCQFIKAQDLFDEMYASLADRSTRQLLKRLARLDVLAIDEFG